MVKTRIATKPYDSADYLKSPEAIAAYLEDALEDNDPGLIAHALGVVARAHGMAEIAKKTKLSREALYRTLSAEGNPELQTLLKVLSQLGLRLSIEPEKKIEQRVAAPKTAEVARVHQVSKAASVSNARSMAGREVVRTRDTKSVSAETGKILSSKSGSGSKVGMDTAASDLAQSKKKK